MKEAIKSIMQKENKIMEYINSNSVGSELRFQKFIDSFSNEEMVVLECLMHIGREKYTKLELPNYNSAEELIDTYYNDIIIKEHKEFNRSITIDRIIEKFPRLSDYLKCAFQVINDPYTSRNLVEI